VPGRRRAPIARKDVRQPECWSIHSINLRQEHLEMNTPLQAAGVSRMQQLMSSSPVPSISTELLATADGELNRELNSFLFDPPSNPDLLKGKRIAICCTNGVEEVEILGAHRWLTEHGATVHVVSPRLGEFHPTLGLRFPPQCATHVLAIRLMENAGWLKIDRYTDEARVEDYDAVLLPGGCWNPDALRMDKHARAFVVAMHEAGKPTCAICHGQWVMVSAGLLKGRRATAVWNIQIDLQNAGATVLDEPCVVDGNLITARFPYDLPRLVRAMVKQLVPAEAQAQAAQ
jgi:protease I